MYACVCVRGAGWGYMCTCVCLYTCMFRVNVHILCMRVCVCVCENLCIYCARFVHIAYCVQCVVVCFVPSDMAFTRNTYIHTLIVHLHSST